MPLSGRRIRDGPDAITTPVRIIRSDETACRLLPGRPAAIDHKIAARNGRGNNLREQSAAITMRGRATSAVPPGGIVPKPPLVALALARFHEARDVRRLEGSFTRRNSTCLTEGAAQSETIGHRSTNILWRIAHVKRFRHFATKAQSIRIKNSELGSCFITCASPGITAKAYPARQKKWTPEKPP